MVTDPVVLSMLARQGIDKDFVYLTQDYAPAYVNGKRVKEQSPYAKFYRDLKSNKRFMVVSGLPMVDHTGQKVIPKWQQAGVNWFEATNLFMARITGTQVELTIRNDQPDGRKTRNRLTFSPQLFLAGVEQLPSNPVLLAVDPLNPNYLENTLEWDCGICKRRLRQIEGKLIGSWVFASKPAGEIRIKYNQIGDYRLRFGQFKVSDDEEVIKPKDFDELAVFQAGYPVTISDSATYYPDADPETTSVDGFARRAVVNESWADIIAGAGTISYPSETYLSVLVWKTGTTQFDIHDRGITLFDTSALPDNAVISYAILSVYAYNKDDPDSNNPTAAVYSSAPASNTDIVAGDYTTLGSTAFSNSISYTNFALAAGYNGFTLNADGRAAISKIGVSKFGFRNNYDVTQTTPTRTTASAWTYCNGCAAEFGAGFKPKLVIEYSVVTQQAVGSGATTPAGTLGRKTSKAIGAGSATPSGILARLPKIQMGQGSITPAGILLSLRRLTMQVPDWRRMEKDKMRVLDRKPVFKGWK